MRKTTTGQAAKAPRNAAASRKFTRRPRIERSWLLASTALFAGVMAAGIVAAPTGVLAASCPDGSVGYYQCSGVQAAQVVLNPSGDFSADFDNTFDQQTGSPGVLIFAGHSDAPGNNPNGTGITFKAGSSIDVVTPAAGLSVLDSGTVMINVNSGEGEDGDASIIGGLGIFIGPSDGNTDSVHVGHVTLNNDGHIEGTGGDAVYVTSTGGGEDGPLTFELQNHSYASMVGYTYGLEEHGVVSTLIDNGNGTLVGLHEDGAWVDGVSNTTDSTAVQVNNNNDGVLAGLNNGLHVDDVGGTGNKDVVVNNGAFFPDDEIDPTEHDGGLIAGLHGDGVYLDQIGGDVTINNGGTLFETPAGDATIDSKADTLLSGFSFFGAGAGYPSNGIYGGEDGIDLQDVTGHIQINNGAYDAYNGETYLGAVAQGGLIIGQHGDGVYIDGAEDGTEVYNNEGIIIGANDGIEGRYLSSGESEYAASINNDYGVIGGLNDGINLRVHDGDTEISNQVGLIAGLEGDAIHVRNYNNGDVSVDNGEDGEDGGLILGGERAVYIDANNAYVGNGYGGLITGEGTYSHPVIELHTSNNEDGGARIENDGVLVGNPSGDAVDLESWLAGGLEEDHVVSDVASGLLGEIVPRFQAIAGDYSEYSWNAGLSGSVSEDSESLDGSASSVLVKARGGATEIDNYSDGIMIGRVNLRGTSEDGEDGTYGNYIENDGVWLTTNGGEDGQFGNEMHGGSDDQIDNNGLIQTALDGSVRETTTFMGVNQFYNGGGGFVPFFEESGGGGASGLVSMIDGGVGDLTQIDHDFIGSYGSDKTSFVGIDVNLGPVTGEELAHEQGANDWSSEDQGNWRSDRLWIGDELGNADGGDGQISGTTGLLIHNTGTALTDAIGDTIVVAHADSNENEDGTAPFYIDSHSQGYLNLGSLGAVQDGLYAWYLKEVDTAVDPDFVLESTWAPQANQLPSLITGAQNLWYDSSGQVEDHIYGGHFPGVGEGGSGADLAVGAAPAGPAVAPSTGMWAKASGSLTTRNTTVEQTIGGISTTIDTGFVQNSFSLLAGADYMPMGDNSGVRVGVFGGYDSSSLSFSSYGATASYTGGTLGGYASYTSADGFYVDGEAKADLLNLSYQAPLAGSFSTSGFATNFGILANTGYRLTMGNSFVEPIGSLAFVHTTLQDFSAGGGSVAFSNGQSLRAGAGVRIGTTVATGNDLTTELSLLGKVWNEFEPSNDVTLTDGVGNHTTFSDNISGVFGEVAATATTYTADHTFSGFVSIGDKFNADFNTVEGKAGIRKAF